MSILKGNYNLKKTLKAKKVTREEEIERKFEKEASKRLGGSMVYVSKKSINWKLDPNKKK